MTRQYEMARVDEAKQGQMIQVVDPALVPERRSWPPRTLLTLLAFILAGIIASFWVILQAAYAKPDGKSGGSQKDTSACANCCKFAAIVHDTALLMFASSIQTITNV